MFDISFAELVVVGIVALIVIGPERLPAVARTAGYFLGRARRYVDQVKHDLHEEMELDSLRKLRDSMHETVNSFENSVRSEINKIQETTETQSAVIPDKQPPFEKLRKISNRSIPVKPKLHQHLPNPGSRTVSFCKDSITASR